MKKFLKYLLFIVFGTFCLMLILDKFYTYIFQHSKPRNKVQNIIRLKDKEYDIAFFGSSRTENHIDCNLIKALTGKSCVNFGVSGATPGDILTLMRVLKSHNVRFGRVVLQIDYSYNDVDLSKYFIANIIPYINNPVIQNELENNSETYWYDMFPFLRYLRNDKVVGLRALVSSLSHKESNVVTKIGYVPKYGHNLTLYGDFPDKIRKDNSKIQTIKALYNDENTRLTFFAAPYCPKVKNRFIIDSIASKFKEFHNYVDLFDQKEEYFFNCGHLNKNGSEAFTRILVKDLIK